MPAKLPPLSILDLVPIVEGADPADALARMTETARCAEALGFARYWLAEHHNLGGVASAAPAVLIAHVAAATTTIRVGSGGVMLPNHAPLVVAEQFGTLATLHPGRIDLGLGRAPGTDGATARALRRAMDPGGDDDFAHDVVELMGYLGEPDPAQAVRALPGAGTHVPVWILGSSLYGAQLAAHLGLPFAFASHFAPAALDDALHVYRAGFRPSRAWPRPHAMVAVNVVCADRDDDAEFLATSMRLRFLGMQRGQRGPLPRPVDPARLRDGWSDAEWLGAARMMSVAAIGGPARVAEQLARLVERPAPHELIVASATHSQPARLASLALLAELAGRAA